MPDSPDFSKYQLNSVRFSLQDLGELSVRLGSSDWYERQGNVVFMDRGDFGIAPYITSATGAGSSIAVTATSEFGSGYNIQMTAGAVAGANAFIDKTIAALNTNKCGIEISFAVGGVFKNISFRLFIDNGLKRYNASVLFDTPNGALNVLNQAGAPVVVIPIWKYVQGLTYYQHIKLVADFTTGKYMRILVNGDLFDLSSIAMQNLGTFGNHNAEMLFNLDGRGTGVDIVSIGQTIITSDEV